MTAFIASDASKRGAGCDIVEIIQDYMDRYSSEATFMGSETCSKVNVVTKTRSASTAAKVTGAVGAIVFAMLAFLACKQVTKRSLHDEEEGYDANDKLADQSFDTHSIGDLSTQAGSMLMGGSGDGAARMLQPINENPGDGPYDECVGDIKQMAKSLSRPSSPVNEVEIPGETAKDASDEEDCTKLCCGNECFVAATACCAVACASDDMNENFAAVKEHVGEAVTSVEDNVKEDIVAIEENMTENVAGLGEDIGKDMAGIVEAAGAGTAAAVVAVGAGAAAAAFAVAGTNETVEDDATESEEAELSPSTKEQEKAEDKAALEENALENIDVALKTANWVGVLGVANEMANVVDTDADATDVDSVAASDHQPDCLSRCYLDSDRLGEISDNIVVVGNLTHEDDVMQVETFENA